ncbi:MAG: immunoglobulin-like domain-containing protein [Acholeplasmatales bacterium]
MRKFKLFVLLLGIFSLFGLHNVKAAPEAADVKVTYYLDGSVAVAETTVSSINVGDLVSLTKPEAVSGNFMFWTVNGAVRRDLPETLSIKASSKLVLKAYYTSSGTKVGVFLDSNLQYISATYANTAVPPTTNLPDKPHSTLDGWALVDDYSSKVTDFTLTEDKTFFVARYTVSDTEKVTVNGVEYVVNSLVTLTSELTNPVWKNASGQVVGYGQSFTFTALENATFTPEASVAPAVDYVTFRGPITLRTGYKTYVGRFDVGTKEVVDFGFILSNGLKAQSTVYNAIAGTNVKEFLMSFDTTKTQPVASYVTYLDGSTVETIETLMEDLLYQTGFEASEGFVASTSYGGGLVKDGWTVVNGTVTETAGSAEDMHIQMRLYSSGTISATYNDVTVVSNISKVEFKAFISHGGESLKVQFSADGSDWSTGTNVTLTDADASYSVVVDIANAKYVRWTTIDANPSKDNKRYNLDDVKIYGMTKVNAAKIDLEGVIITPTEYIAATNLTLPTIGSVYGSSILWESSHPSIISDTGIMVLPENTTEVTLTATATNGLTNTYTKTYKINVIGIGTRLQAQLDGLEALPSQTSSNLTLADTTADGTIITWTSSNETYITNAGVVTQPTGSNVDVTMTASVTEGSITKTRQFVVTVIVQGGSLSPLTITLTESAIWSAGTGSYAAGNFEKDFDGVTITADDSGIYTGSNYGDNKIQVRKSYGWIYNKNIPSGYIIKSITVNGQNSGGAEIYFSTTTAKATTNLTGTTTSGTTSSGDVSAEAYKYFYIKGKSNMSGTVTIDSIVIELIPAP